MSKIGKLSMRIQRAERAMALELERQFPLLSEVEFDIMHGQVKPSRGEIIGYSGTEHAYLRIRIRSRTNPTRDIPSDRVRLVRAHSKIETGE